MNGRTLGGVSAFRKARGWVKGTCTWCAGPTPKARLWCGDPCIHEYKVRNEPGYARAEVLKRDRGVCAGCGLDTDAVLRRLVELVDAARAAWTRPQEPYRVYSMPMEEFLALPKPVWDRAAAHAASRRYHDAMNEAGFAVPEAQMENPVFHTEHRHLWEMDHILPVVEGGGGCALDNLRTLCRACHNAETAALAARRAAARRAERAPVSLFGVWPP